MKLDNNNHSVFLLYSHLVLVVKYRRKVFSDQMSQYAKDIFVRIGSSYNITLEEWYRSWERTQNERHNGLLRDFIPKGMSIEQFSDEDILNMADTLNQRPRRVLGYHTPSELFDAFLDEVYAIECVS
ncbi:MAG: hypothetical protein ACFWTM_01855 [Mitsuokella multacida]|jgi:hypothetical protein